MHVGKNNTYKKSTSSTSSISSSTTNNKTTNNNKQTATTSTSTNNTHTKQNRKKASICHNARHFCRSTHTPLLRFHQCQFFFSLFSLFDSSHSFSLVIIK
eukprot:comp21755_c0_seq1/m.48627 comp21755_c0_seq1/g.48627  ORF comp21755_c0_seq1/g.48627 comp21755_c0_seq1/m.48627 type:complete len:100 (+) comp21755_c0_seq1:2585-2884(+)